MNFFGLILLSLLLASCSKLTVYKLGANTDSDMYQEFAKSDFLIHGSKDQNFDSQLIKAKIASHLTTAGYTTYTKTGKVFPRYVILFDWKTDFDTKQCLLPVYESGETTRTSGSGYSSDGYFSYSGSSTSPGSIKYIPYEHKTHNASLSVYVADTQIEDTNHSIVWSSRVFFCGDKAKNIDQAVDYLIPAIFDRFGKPIEGRAEEYKFTGNEVEIKSLQKMEKPKEFIKRQLSSKS